MTDECYAEFELGNWTAGQTTVWKRHRSCCWKSN